MLLFAIQREANIYGLLSPSCGPQAVIEKK